MPVDCEKEKLDAEMSEVEVKDIRAEGVEGKYIELNGVNHPCRGGTR